MEIWASAWSGVIVKVHLWSDTHVSSSGGGGYISPAYGGYISAPQISSDVIQRCKIVVKRSDGTERDFDVSDYHMTFSEGQKIIAVWGSVYGGEAGNLEYICNYTTNKALSNNRFNDLESYKNSKSYDEGFVESIAAGLILWGVLWLIFGASSGWLFWGEIVISFIAMACSYQYYNDKSAKETYPLEKKRREIYAAAINSALSKENCSAQIKNIRWMKFE